MGFTCQRRTEYITDGDKCVKAFLHCCTEMADQKKEAKDEQLHLARSKNPHIYILCGNTHTCRHTHTLSQTHIHTYPPTKMHTQNICTNKHIHTHKCRYIHTYSTSQKFGHTFSVFEKFFSLLLLFSTW